MVILVILHMARVFYTAAYKRPREFNWVLGMMLFVVTLGLSFTGYLLPWDQLAYWAVTIGSAIAASPSELTDAVGVTQHFDPGGLIREVLLGAHFIGEEALIRFYTLHMMVLPILLCAILGVHYWRIRKDGGLARPLAAAPRFDKRGDATAASPTKTYGLMAVVAKRTPATDQAIENTVPSWPRVFRIESALMMAVLIVLMLLSLALDAPLKEMANPEVPENPAKAPWYFLGLQELVSYSALLLLVSGGLARYAPLTTTTARVMRERLSTWVLLLCSLGAFALLVYSAYNENFAADWYRHQNEYKQRLVSQADSDLARIAAERFDVGRKQLFLPDLECVDRCVTCHVGIDNRAMADASQPLTSHPGDYIANHPKERFGCTICHRGQGRATEQADAHGHVPHWPEPMVEREQTHQACIRCHTERSLPEADTYNAAMGLVYEKACFACHTIRGKGGDVGPVLDRAGETHDAEWHFRHFKDPKSVVATSEMPNLELTARRVVATRK